MQAALPPGSVVLAPRSDGHFVATLPDGSRRALHLGWAGYGYPRDVQRTLADPDLVRARDDDHLIVVAAHAVSAGARQLLQAAGASWVGLDGSASLHLGTVWVDRDATREHPASGSVASWSRGRADVAEALLAMLSGDRSQGPLPVPDVESIARLSGRSLGTVANTLARFDAEGWTSAGGRSRGRLLTNGPALLDSWTAWETSQRRRFDGFHSVHRHPERVVAQLVEAFGNSLILTGVSSSETAVPTLTGSWVVTAYVETTDGWPDIDAGTRRAKLIPAAVPRLRLAPATPVIRDTTTVRAGIRVASSARTYADLRAGGDREQEAADRFRSTTMPAFS